MNDGEGSGPNRTVFQPSPLQQRKAASGTDFAPRDRATAAGRPRAQSAQVSARLADDIPEAPNGLAPRNAMMTQGAPLLALLAAMRAGRAQMTLPELHLRADDEIETFRREMQRLYSEEEVRRATYALAATTDDIALNLPFNESDVADWAQQSLVVRFFHEAIGGDRFWRLLEEMVARPNSYLDLLELYHACMAAGFEGRYRLNPGGSAQHAAIMQQVYRALPHAAVQSRSELSPQWRGVTAAASAVGLWSRVAMVAAATSGVLLVAYLILHLWSASAGALARQVVARLVEDEPLTLSRAARAAPVSASAQGDSIRRRLTSRIQSGEVEVLDETQDIRVRTIVPSLFAPGSDHLLPKYDALFQEVAQALNAQPGAVRVEGHTDSDRPRGATFSDNQELSKARAEVASGIIRGALNDKSRRVTTEGFGDGRPLKSNRTEEGKSRNRRVEVVIDRSDR